MSPAECRGHCTGAIVLIAEYYGVHNALWPGEDTTADDMPQSVGVRQSLSHTEQQASGNTSNSSPPQGKENRQGRRGLQTRSRNVKIEGQYRTHGKQSKIYSRYKALKVNIHIL